MSDSITQLTLWENPEQPEFSARIRHAEHNGETYYSLVDIMAEFVDTSAARQYWADTKKRLKRDGFQLSEKILQLKLSSSDGKLYKTDCADTETCLRIVQSIPSPKAEPIRQWLAHVAQERLEETANPELGMDRAQQRAIETYRRRGKDEMWIATRLNAIDDRKAFTEALSRYVVDIVARDYATATDAVSVGLWGRDTATLKAQLGLPRRANLRDFQPRIAAHYQAIVEASVTLRLGEAETAPIQQAIQIIYDIAKVVGIQASELGALLGIDIPTGKRLIE